MIAHASLVRRAASPVPPRAEAQAGTPERGGLPSDPWQDDDTTAQADRQSTEPSPGSRRLADCRARLGR